MQVIAFLVGLVAFFLGAALVVGIIEFFIDWVCEEDIKKTWPVRFFTKKYAEYYKWQNDTIKIYCNKGNRFWFDYTEKKTKDFPTIAFNQFKDFYSLNPESWSLRECRVIKDNNDELSLTFTYQEWKKYKKFKEQVEEEKEQQKERLANQKAEKEKVETTRKVLEAVQKDIDNIRAEAEKEFQEAKQVVEKASCEHKDVQHINRRTALNTVLKYDICKSCGQILKFYKE